MWYQRYICKKFNHFSLVYLHHQLCSKGRCISLISCTAFVPWGVYVCWSLLIHEIDLSLEVYLFRGYIDILLLFTGCLRILFLFYKFISIPEVHFPNFNFSSTGLLFKRYTFIKRYISLWCSCLTIYIYMICLFIRCTYIMMYIWSKAENLSFELKVCVSCFQYFSFFSLPIKMFVCDVICS